MRPVLFFSIGIFMLEMLKKYGIFLIGWLRILMNLRLVVLIPTTHSLASLFALPLCETCHCSNHDSMSCPYYISDEGFA